MCVIVFLIYLMRRLGLYQWYMARAGTMEIKLKLRRVVLYLIAGVFFFIAMASLVMPNEMAKPLGYELISLNALNEFRAIYVGLWLAHVLIFVIAARNIHQVILGDVCGILVAGQVVGRLISLAIDGVPSVDLFPVATAEALGAIILFALRPRPAVPPPDS